MDFYFTDPPIKPMSTRPGDSADDDRPADGNDRPRPSSPADPDAEFAWLRPYVSGPAFIFITSNVGFVLVALAQFCFACMNITVKYFLSITPVTVTTLILVRMGISSVGSILALYLMGDPNPVLGPPEMRRYLYARGVAGFVGLFAAYKSYIGLSVSDSMAIGYLTPSLSAIFAFFFLGERCSRREILAGVACLGGVLLISRPPMIFGEYGSGEGSPADETGGAPPPDVPAMSRMQGVAWALVGVCGATMACE
jgi:drug/metabolite transporter (DMT)-like permease